jgi:hypothetical protein
MPKPCVVKARVRFLKQTPEQQLRCEEALEMYIRALVRSTISRLERERQQAPTDPTSAPLPSSESGPDVRQLPAGD